MKKPEAEKNLVLLSFFKNFKDPFKISGITLFLNLEIQHRLSSVSHSIDTFSGKFNLVWISL
jgi:hypothetical protein